MGFTRSTTDISVHQKLDDYPNRDDGLTPEEIKKRYDYPAETLQNDLNKLEAELENINASTNIGANKIDDNDTSEPNIQAKLIRIYEQLQNVILNQIPDGTITTEKVADYAISNEKIKLNSITEDRLAFGFGFVPSGAICIWAGTEVPYGWYLCNGENGTPDLRDRFVMGAGIKYTIGTKGGSTPAINVNRESSSGTGNLNYLTVSGNATLPPYYALAFIMKA